MSKKTIIATAVGLAMAGGLAFAQTGTTPTQSGTSTRHNRHQQRRSTTRHQQRRQISRASTGTSPSLRHDRVQHAARVRRATTGTGSAPERRALEQPELAQPEQPAGTTGVARPERVAPAAPAPAAHRWVRTTQRWVHRAAAVQLAPIAVKSSPLQKKTGLHARFFYRRAVVRFGLGANEPVEDATQRLRFRQHIHNAVTAAHRSCSPRSRRSLSGTLIQP